MVPVGMPPTSLRVAPDPGLARSSEDAGASGMAKIGFVPSSGWSGLSKLGSFRHGDGLAPSKLGSFRHSKADPRGLGSFRQGHGPIPNSWRGTGDSRLPSFLYSGWADPFEHGPREFPPRRQAPKSRGTPSPVAPVAQKPMADSSEFSQLILRKVAERRLRAIDGLPKPSYNGQSRRGSGRFDAFCVESRASRGGDDERFLRSSVAGPDPSPGTSDRRRDGVGPGRDPRPRSAIA